MIKYYFNVTIRVIEKYFKLIEKKNLVYKHRVLLFSKNQLNMIMKKCNAKISVILLYWNFCDVTKCMFFFVYILYNTYICILAIQYIYDYDIIK